MEALQENIERLKNLKVNADGSRNRRRTMSSNSSLSNDSAISDSTMNGMEDFKFTYEEESDPEIFFIPYVWEVIVSTVTSSSIEWDKIDIKVFSIMHHEVNGIEDAGNDGEGALLYNEYAENVDDVV